MRPPAHVCLCLYKQERHDCVSSEKGRATASRKTTLGARDGWRRARLGGGAVDGPPDLVPLRSPRSRAVFGSGAGAGTRERGRTHLPGLELRATARASVRVSRGSPARLSPLGQAPHGARPPTASGAALRRPAGRLCKGPHATRGGTPRLWGAWACSPSRAPA